MIIFPHSIANYALPGTHAVQERATTAAASNRAVFMAPREQVGWLATLAVALLRQSQIPFPPHSHLMASRYHVFFLFLLFMRVRTACDKSEALAD